MSGLVDAAAAILLASERRLEIAANNVANISTPGFKRETAFERLLVTDVGTSDVESAVLVARDLAQGALTATGAPLDLAISGAGFFQLRAGAEMLYSRQGQFRLAADGTVVTPQGYALQQAGGGDLILERADVTVADDGTVLDRGLPVARIQVHAAEQATALKGVSGSYFTAPAGVMAPVEGAVLRQGMVESSNVTMGDEMVSVVSAQRHFETGARLVQVYDELLGQAFSKLGAGR